MSNDFILEVDESLREEKLHRLWKEYGGYLIAACILAVLFTALIVGWRGWDEKVAAQQTSIIIQAMDTDNPAENLGNVSVALNDGRKAIALLSAAGEFVREGDNKGALKQYQLLKMDQSAPKVFRDYAAVMEARTMWDLRDEFAAEKVGADKAAAKISEDEDAQDAAVAVAASTSVTDVDPKALLTMMAPICNDPSNPWRWHALIQSSVILASGLDNYKQAVAYLSLVEAQEDLPQSLHSRAAALKHVYSLKLTEMSAQAEKDKK